MKKFTVVSNPPFLKDLHLSFLQKCVSFANEIVMVHPSTWLIQEKDFTSKGVQYQKMRALISDSAVSFTLVNGNYLFKIGLFVPCVITHLKEGANTGTFTVVDINNKKHIYQNIDNINQHGSNKEYFSLKKKILSFPGKTLQDVVIKKSKDIPPNKIYVSLGMIRGSADFVNKDRLRFNDFFTFISKTATFTNDHNSVLGTTNVFTFASEVEASNFIKYLKTKVARFALSIYKVNSQISSGEMNSVPFLDFTTDWDDASLCKKFNISNEEWKFINEVIPDYY